VAAKKPRKKRTTYHHGDLRNALVAAARDLISTGSPEQITLREVSRRVGVNHRAVYRHFADLTSLLAAVAEEGYRALIDELTATLAPMKRSSTEKRLEALGVTYVAFAVDHPAHYRIMFGRRLNEDGRFPELEDLVERAYAVLAGELRAGQASGRFADVPLREAVFSFWALAHGFASLALVRRIRVKRSLLEDYSRQLFAPVLAGFRT
jgi:AcrR family transcriptional regulator